MKRFITNINKMNLFQKIQVLSGVIPLYSFIFVFLTSYIASWKGKKGYFQLVLFSVTYFALVFFCWKLNMHFVVKYIICCLISIVGNYMLVSTQINNT